MKRSISKHSIVCYACKEIIEDASLTFNLYTDREGKVIFLHNTPECINFDEEKQ